MHIGHRMSRWPFSEVTSYRIHVAKNKRIPTEPQVYYSVVRHVGKVPAARLPLLKSEFQNRQDLRRSLSN